MIELMVVVVLIGIMAAMIVPEMKGTYEDVRLRATSRELVAVCNTASSRAISLNQLLRVRLEKRTGKYAIERKLIGGRTAASFVPMRDLPGGEGTLDPRISIEIRSLGEAADRAEPDQTAPASAPADAPDQDRAETIAFYPDGTADAVEILLQDLEGFRLALRINPVTARVRAVELEHR